MNYTKQQRRALEKENAKRSEKFEPILKSEWPVGFRLMNPQPMAVWRSCDYLVQVFNERGLAEIRFTVCRTTMRSDNKWDDDISWDELQKIKADIGYGHMFAVEIYPPDYDVVNVANMRHLWLMKNSPAIGWKR